MRPILFLLLGSLVLTAEQPARNWTGDYAPCKGNPELLKRGHMELKVRISTANQVLAKEFLRAMDFWSRVVDMNWQADNSNGCSVQIVDGTPELFSSNGALVARSQFVDWMDFQGWIAFNRKVPLTRTEWFLTAIHEFGHMLGLRHNPSARSVMYAIDLNGSESLDATDLAALADRHKLRVTNSDAPIAAMRRSPLDSFRDLRGRAEP